MALSKPEKGLRKNIANHFVTVRRLKMNQNDINSMFVKLGKINGFVRERGRSGVWSFFGELFYKESKAGEVCSVDNQRHYCSLCLKSNKFRIDTLVRFNRTHYLQLHQHSMITYVQHMM